MILDNDVDMDGFINSVESDETREAQGNANGGWQFPTTVGIGKAALVRFVNGYPSSPTDPAIPGSGRAKLVNIAWVKDDDNKNIKLVLPAIIDNKPQYPSVILDFIDKVLSRTWVDYTEAELAANESNPKLKGKKGRYVYFYENRDDYGAMQSGSMTLAQIFHNVFKSGHQPGEQYYDSQKSWRGQTVYIANVIDRLDPAWHAKNKKTKILMRKAELKGEKISNKEVSWFCMGAPLQELTGQPGGRKLNYDVLIWPGKETTDKFNLKNVSKLKSIDYFDEVAGVLKFERDADGNILSTSDLKAKGLKDDRFLISESNTFSEEEMTYEAIDIDKLYRFTSASTFIKHFGKMVQAFDDMTGTDFMPRLKHEAEMDKAAKEAAKAESAPKTESVNPTTPVQPTATVTPTAPVAPTVQVTEPATTVTAATPAVEPMASTPTVTPTVNAPATDVDAFYADLD